MVDTGAPWRGQMVKSERAYKRWLLHYPKVIGTYGMPSDEWGRGLRWFTAWRDYGRKVLDEAKVDRHGI